MRGTGCSASPFLAVGPETSYVTPLLQSLAARWGYRFPVWIHIKHRSPCTEVLGIY